MRPLKRVWQIIPGAALMMLAVAMPSVHAQENKTAAATAAGAAQPAAPNAFQGIAGCVACHNQAERVDPELSRALCLLNEDRTFRDDDKHSQAYELLIAKDQLGNDGLGLRIAEKLGIDLRHPERDKVQKDPAKTARQCLSCHSGWPWKQNQDAPPLSYKSGVTCESCHGPSGNWDKPHRLPNWRATLTTEKESLGMINIRDPLRRARLCYSCHIGDSDEGKVVTHDMYAAGHPQLPSIEIETFVAAMPAHSRKLQEKGHFQFESDFIPQNRLGASIDEARSDRPRTKGVLVGGIVALSESLQLFAKETGPGKGLEFALFDCQACHHDLRLPAWRQSRSGGGRPGRPRPPEWPSILAKIGVSQAELHPEAAQKDLELLQNKLQELAQAVDERPFGGSAKVQEVINGKNNQGNGLIDWLDKKAHVLAMRQFSNDDAQRALKQLYKLGSTGVHDFHSARQIAWAIRAIEAENGLNYPSFPAYVADLPDKERRNNEERDIEIWRTWHQREWQSADARAAAIIGPLNEPLQLILPARQQGSVVKNLGPFLKSNANYDPELFRRLVKESDRQSDRAAVK
jgi:hypothetical protein